MFLTAENDVLDAKPTFIFFLVRITRTGGGVGLYFSTARTKLLHGGFGYFCF